MRNFHKRRKGIHFRTGRKSFPWKKGLAALMVLLFIIASIFCAINGFRMHKLHKQAEKWEERIAAMGKREDKARQKTAELSGGATKGKGAKEKQKNVRVALDDSALFMGDFFFDTLATSNLLSGVSYLTKLGLGVKSVWQLDGFQTREGKRDAPTAIHLLKPKALFLMIGLYDLQSLSIEEIIQEYGIFLEKIQAENKDMAIILISIPPVRASYQGSGEGNPVNQSVLDAYNEAQKQLAENLNLCYLDAAQGMKDEDGYLRAAYAEADGLHWTKEGCMKFVEMIKESDYIEK